MNTTETMTTWADNATDRTIVGIEDRHTLLLLCKCGRMRVSGIGPFLPTLAYNYEIDVFFFCVHYRLYWFFLFWVQHFIWTWRMVYREQKFLPLSAWIFSFGVFLFFFNSGWFFIPTYFYVVVLSPELKSATFLPNILLTKCNYPENIGN